MVYTGLGALNWLPDIERWATAMAQLVAPGGHLYLAEFHPFSWIFADEDLSVAHPYFHADPLVMEEPGTYAQEGVETEHNRTIEWNAGIGTVVSSIAAAGLRIELLHEHEETLFGRWPFLERDRERIYRLPEGMPSLPLMYSLRAGAEALDRFE